MSEAALYCEHSGVAAVQPRRPPEAARFALAPRCASAASRVEKHP
ncbi:hypothetical protein HMPREF0972_00018 [Actinomyces sp. oral taxon 848 str. F0332]|nr:hypothetical protein HMPREF0972_00018 [Actinomyces sp. oral taxon 848 str. F0332]